MAVESFRLMERKHHVRLGTAVESVLIAASFVPLWLWILGFRDRWLFVLLVAALVAMVVVAVRRVQRVRRLRTGLPSNPGQSTAEKSDG